MQWTLEAVKKRLEEIKAKGYIGIPTGMHRTDDGIVGQILEREFKVAENNVSVRDLGTFELKGIRATSSNITLSHKKAQKGCSPIDIFNRFGYIRASNRDPSVLKKKLFVTINGVKANRQGLKLRGINDTDVDMVFCQEVVCEWDLTNPLQKMDQIILGIAKTTGKTNAPDERFYYESALLLDGLRPLKELIDKGIIVIEMSVDQPVRSDGTPLAPPHDRGPHIRAAVKKLPLAYKRIVKIL
jgi:hypothetical protein